MTIRLIIEALDARLGTFTQELDQPLITFGRSKSCHVELDNPDISKKHFSIKFIDNTYILLDENSRNGTLLDGEKINSLKNYLLASEHTILIPGFSIKLFFDGKKPALERTTVVTRKLLDELLQDDVDPRECPCLQSKNGCYCFKFIEQKTSYVLGSQHSADFVVADKKISKKHLSFARDINGIRLIPLPEHEVLINDKTAIEPKILTHGDTIKVGDTEFIFNEHAQEKIFFHNEKNKINEHEEKKFTEHTAQIIKKIPAPNYLLQTMDRFFLFGFLLVLVGVLGMLFKMI